MAGRLQRLITRIESSATFGEYVWRALQAVGIAGVGGMTSWAAAASDWLDAYGPIAWVSAGLLGALITCACLALAGIFRDRLARARTISILATTPKSVNPLDNTFVRQRINLMDFYSPFGEPAAGKTFIECELIGPCVVALTGVVNIDGFGLILCDFVKCNENVPVKNAVGFLNVTIRNCRLYRVTLLVAEGVGEQFEAAAGRVPWINA